ncbi:branched-chain amino acid transport system ATP-binding protein [Aromatoleum tolulyticum]|uniref:Branched-chain amino acid transport system ATP-binding protein n=1 Tax=Aromatoleum tolulyticum TaxID=34027 RepID=A0A1N6QBT9_9RHOO|nr:hemerythrin domain-containing protein [Aromatoleum tolulyticum]SIQ14067.1 branched-chain amino acid transport system ATP-binding protein [Aromatoleum tolulyticum]
MKALDIIHDEHRALGAVLQAFGFVLDGIRDGHFEPDFALLAAMIEYITEVPDKLHHPKEDDYLFVKMRERIPAAAGLLDQLEADHAEGARRTAALRGALVHYQGVGAAAFPEFEATARTYLAASWRHVSREETELLPMARTGLAAEDWADIDAAFEANKDPWSGPTGQFRALFSRIVNLVPAPYGVGASPTKV